MKIAIPTHDGITVAPVFRHARGFLICTIEFGEITHEEIRWNLLSEILTAEDGFFYNLKDCSLVIANSISDYAVRKLLGDDKKVIISEETVITNALLHYRDQEMVVESNLTCCP